MYSIKEKRKINKLNRRLAISWLIIFFLVLWLKNKYDDSNYYYSEKNYLEEELIDKDYDIQQLNQKLESLSKIKTKEINTNKAEKLNSQNKVKVKKENVKSTPVDTISTQQKIPDQKDTL